MKLDKLNPKLVAFFLLLGVGCLAFSQEALKHRPVPDIEALREAILVSDIVKAKAQIEAGVNIDSRDRLGWPPILTAVKYNSLETLKVLLEAGANVNGTSEDGVTALMLCGIKSNLTLARYLISMKANVNQQDVDRQPALFYAARSGNCELIKLLLAQGASAATRAKTGHTVLMELWEPNEKYECLDALIKAGADVNAQDNQGMSVLMYKIRSHQQEYVRFLIESGATVDVKDKQGWSALDQAKSDARMYRDTKILDMVKDALAKRKTGN